MKNAYLIASLLFSAFAFWHLYTNQDWLYFGMCMSWACACHAHAKIEDLKARLVD